MPAAPRHGQHGRHGACRAATVSVADLDTDTEAQGRRRGRPDRSRRARSSSRRARPSRATPSTAPRPGPLIEATVGQLVEVHLHNENVKGGVALHWHGVDVPERRGRRRRGHPGRGRGRRGLHLPLGRAARGHLLVPLPPALARAGRRRPARRHRRSTRSSRSPASRDVLALAHLYDGPADPQRRHRGPARRRRSRASGCGCGWSTPTTVPQTPGPSVPFLVRRRRRVRRQRARPRSPTGRSGIPAGGRVDLEVTVPDRRHRPSGSSWPATWVW